MKLDRINNFTLLPKQTSQSQLGNRSDYLSNKMRISMEKQMTTSGTNSSRTIAVLHPTVPMPDFGFFQVVKVKTTKEVGTIAGMWCVETEEETHQWLYRIDGLTQLSANWWQADQLRNLHRRASRQNPSA